MPGAVKLVFVGIGFWYALTVGVAELKFKEADIYSGQGDWARTLLTTVEGTAYNRGSYYVGSINATLFGVADFLPPPVVLYYLERSLAIDPNSPQTLWFMIMQHLRTGDLTKALPYLEHLERIGPGWPQTENARRVYLAVGQAVKQRQGQSDAKR